MEMIYREFNQSHWDRARDLAPENLHKECVAIDVRIRRQSLVKRSEMRDNYMNRTERRRNNVIQAVLGFWGNGK